MIDQPTIQPKQHLQVEPRARLQTADSGELGLVVVVGVLGEETRAKEEERKRDS